MGGWIDKQIMSTISKRDNTFRRALLCMTGMYHGKNLRLDQYNLYIVVTVQHWYQLPEVVISMISGGGSAPLRYVVRLGSIESWCGTAAWIVINTDDPKSLTVKTITNLTYCIIKYKSNQSLLYHLSENWAVIQKSVLVEITLVTVSFRCR